MNRNRQISVRLHTITDTHIGWCAGVAAGKMENDQPALVIGLFFCYCCCCIHCLFRSFAKEKMKSTDQRLSTVCPMSVPNDTFITLNCIYHHRYVQCTYNTICRLKMCLIILIAVIDHFIMITILPCVRRDLAIDSHTSFIIRCCWLTRPSIACATTRSTLSHTVYRYHLWQNS